MEIVIVKWIHVLSSTLLFGTGIGSAFYLLAATLNGDARVVAPVARFVVRADWMFTATTAVIQPATGAWLAWRYGIGMDATWIRVSVILYVIAIACWLPVVWLQTRLRDTAQAALQADAAGSGSAAPNGTASAGGIHGGGATERGAVDRALPVRLPASYRRYFAIWFALGIPAFIAFLAIFYLMVAKTP
ncbi:DUF2269 domain-containing protein [Bordetella sputigena]|uniref:DUF2269 family protein n=1 Tax=Bordetella sputigena TaxID=1416810 RepID=UPI0039EE58FA